MWRVSVFLLLFSALQDARPLKPNEPLENQLSGGAKHVYTLTLDTNQHIAAVVEQHGINVRVQALGPTGEVLGEWDRDPFPEGQESAEFVSSAAGAYQLIVESTQRTGAGRYRILSTDPRQATERDQLLQEARANAKRGNDLMRAGSYDSARALLQRSLEIREQILGPGDAEVAAVLLPLGNTYYFQRRLEAAETLYRRAVSIYETVLGSEHPLLAVSLNNLANLYQVNNEFDKSETLHLRALSIRERALGPDHPDVAQTLNNLGNLYAGKGAFDKVEPMYERALAINEKLLGPDDIALASPLANLASVLRKKGDYVQAERLLQRALALREKRWGPEHPDVATALVNLGEIYRETGDSRAEPIHRRALAIREKMLGADHPDVGKSLSYLGLMSLDAGNLANAEALFLRSVAIKEKALEPDHPELASSIAHLAELYSVRGEYAKAEPLYLRALTITERGAGPQHPNVIGILDGLARLYAATGRISDAIDYERRALATRGFNLELNLATGSERQKLAYVGLLSGEWDEAISLNVVVAPHDESARRLALSTILQLKGRVQDAVGQGFAALRQRLNSEDQTLMDRLNDVNEQLAKVVLDGPSDTLEGHQRLIADLETRKEQIERDISERSKGYYAGSRPVTVDLIQQRIPPTAALVEFALYRRFDMKAQAEQSGPGEERYIAYVLRHDGPPTFSDLGPAESIDRAIAAFRSALRDPKRRDAGDLARTLDDKVMRPIRPLLGNSTHVIISPDGALNLVPFAALMDEHRQYLVQRWSITYLSSGRDLLRFQHNPVTLSPPVIMASPAFGEPHAVNASKSVTTGFEMSDVYFVPLPSTAEEARAVHALFPDATLLTGARATESALKQQAAPAMLHIATHGFFLAAPKRRQTQASTARGINSTTQIENPLLRSGLALVGANRRGGAGDDGILTAMEASGLNLWGTKLVTLSACDTGLGEVRNGEGVYGLRRSFVLAGAETIVMSLWAVSDLATRELMTGYYTGLKYGLGRGEALRQIQLRMLKRADRRHPFYWASFIQTGNWLGLNE